MPVARPSSRFGRSGEGPMSLRDSANPSDLPSAAGRRVQRLKRWTPISITEIIDELLLRPRDVLLNGEKKRLATIGVILMRLMQKDLAGSRRARNVLLKYKEFFGR